VTKSDISSQGLEAHGEKIPEMAPGRLQIEPANSIAFGEPFYPGAELFHFEPAAFLLC